MRVREVLELHAAGTTREEILADCLYLEADDVIAVLDCAAPQNDHPVLRSPLACALAWPYSARMMPLRARVENGRLQLDTPTELPDGTEVDLVADDGGDDLTDSERQALHEALSKSSASAEAGNLRPASAIIEELRRRV